MPSKLSHSACTVAAVGSLLLAAQAFDFQPGDHQAVVAAGFVGLLLAFALLVKAIEPIP